MGDGGEAGGCRGVGLAVVKVICSDFLLETALRHRRIFCLIAVAMSCLQVAVIISSAMMFRDDMVYVDFR